MERVSWLDAQEFLSRLNAWMDGYVYRLPTEAEWEYAARSGTRGKAADEMNIEALENMDSHDFASLMAVNERYENAWGLFGMLDNVAEWCEDWYGSRYYRSSRYFDPQGPRSGRRVLRGGGYDYISPIVVVAG